MPEYDPTTLSDPRTTAAESDPTTLPYKGSRRSGRTFRGLKYDPWRRSGGTTPRPFTPCAPDSSPRAADPPRVRVDLVTSSAGWCFTRLCAFTGALAPILAPPPVAAPPDCCTSFTFSSTSHAA